MEEEFLSFFSLSEDLVLHYEIEHGQEGSTMHPDTKYLDNDTPLFIFLDDALRQEYS